MSAEGLIRNWRAFVRIGLILLALSFCLCCVLAGVRPGWLSEFHVVRVIAFRDTLEILVHAVPVVGAVFDTVLPKVLEKAGVPQSISIYAASYCSTSYGASGVATSDCFLHKSAHFDAAAALRIYMAIAYALGAFCSAVSLACLSQRMWNGSDRWRHFALVSTSVATGAVFAASLITSILACAVYMVLSDNLPEPLLFVAIGKTFFAFTWSAFALLATVLFTILPRKQPGAA